MLWVSTQKREVIPKPSHDFCFVALSKLIFNPGQSELKMKPQTYKSTKETTVKHKAHREQETSGINPAANYTQVEIIIAHRQTIHTHTSMTPV